MDLTRLRRLRAMFARLREEGKLIHGGGSVELLDVRDKLYTERTKLPKWTVKQSIHGPINQVEAGRILARRMPTWTPEHHKKAADLFDLRAERAKDAYSRMIDKAHWETFGKKYTFPNQESGPLISGIISDKYPERWKTRLRFAAHRITEYQNAARAHRGAAAFVTRSSAQLNRINRNDRQRIPNFHRAAARATRRGY